MTAFDKAFIQVQTLVQKFDRDIKHYMSAGYSEAEARQDFIDNFFIALGWDVNHQTQTNPYEQEVKIERSQKQQNESARKRADYAFYFAPNFKDEIFFVEAKKPSVLITRNEQHYFQTIRYGWNAGCPISVLTDFEEFVIVDCRAKPNIKYALNGQHKSFKYTDYANKEKLAVKL
jgi:adenine-specific DNA-methyltransferase